MAKKQIVPEEEVQDYELDNYEGNPVIPPGMPAQSPEFESENPVEDLVHDEQGNVRAGFSAEGIGEVTEEDALEALGLDEEATEGERLEPEDRDSEFETLLADVRRRDQVIVKQRGDSYDIYTRAGVPLVFGVDAEGLRRFI